MGDLGTGGLFLSYSRADVDAVRALAEKLEMAGETVFLDLDMHGGDAWWDTILSKIRECRVFVVAVSQKSLDSQPCVLERGYAQALGLPILPVQVGDVSSFRIDKVFRRQLIDLRPGHDTSMTPFALTKALKECAADRRELPDPLPPPPPMPYEYIQVLADKIKARQTIPHDQQIALYYELRKAMSEEPEESVREDVRALLMALMNRSDVSHIIAKDISEELGLTKEKRAHSPEPEAPRPPDQSERPATPPGASRPAQWLPDPAGSGRLRYWDGVRWTDTLSEVPTRHDAPKTQPSTPPGWYPDVRDRNRQRYWDGTAWTGHYSAAASGTAAAGGVAARQAPAPPNVSRPLPTVPPKKSNATLVLAVFGAFAVVWIIILVLSYKG